MIAIGLQGGNICLVDAETGAIKWDVQAHAGSLYTSVAVSPDGRWVASVGIADRQWKLWDSIDGTLRMAVPSHDGRGECMCGGDAIFDVLCPLTPVKEQLVVQFSPCNKWVACGSIDGNIALWDIRTEVPQLQWHLETESKQFDTLSFSADGSLISCGGYEDEAYIVTVETGILRQSWKASAGGIFSPINNNLLATGTRFAVTLWDVERETLIWTQDAGHSFEEDDNFTAFSTDGLTIATVSQLQPDSDAGGSDDDSDEPPPHIKLLDVATGDIKQTLDHARSSSIWGASFSVSPYRPRQRFRVQGSGYWKLPPLAFLEVKRAAWSNT
jgi:WD40 repeat protein